MPLCDSLQDGYVCLDRRGLGARAVCRAGDAVFWSSASLARRSSRNRAVFSAIASRSRSCSSFKSSLRFCALPRSASALRLADEIREVGLLISFLLIDGMPARDWQTLVRRLGGLGSRDREIVSAALAPRPALRFAAAGFSPKALFR